MLHGSVELRGGTFAGELLLGNNGLAGEQEFLCIFACVLFVFRPSGFPVC